MTEFETFWQNYPRKIGRIAAEKAYAKARRRATAAEILSGVENYRQHLPDDMQFVCHASTFLNQGRWMDQYEPLRKAQPAPAVDWYQECQEIHGGVCGLDRFAHHLRKQREAS